MNNNRQDILWIHIIRVLACLQVCMLHSLPSINFELSEFDEKFRWSIILFTRTCVPLFFMITGYLILPIQSYLLVFYKKRIPKVLFPLIVWGAVYAVLPCLLDIYDSRTMIRELFLSPIKAPQEIGGILWYLFILIGIYLFLPYLNRSIYSDNKMLNLWLVLWLVSGCFVIIHDYVPNTLGENGFLHSFNALLYFSGYMGYLILGYAVKHGLNMGIPLKMGALGRSGGG